MKKKASLILFLISFSLIIVNVQVGVCDEEVEEFSIIIFEQVIGNRNHKPTKDINIPSKKIVSCVMEIKGYCDPDDPYSRAIHFHLDDVGGPIGCSRSGPGQVTGATFGSDRVVEYEYDMSEVKFAKANPATGSEIIDFIPKNDLHSDGVLSPGIHTLDAYVSSDDGASGVTLESWISVTLYFNKDTSSLSSDSPSPDTLFIILILGAIACIGISSMIIKRQRSKDMARIKAKGRKTIKRKAVKVYPKSRMKVVNPICLKCGNALSIKERYCLLCGEEANFTK